MESQDARKTASITNRTRNGRIGKIRVEYSPANLVSSPNQRYDVTRPAQIRYQPHLANAARSAQVRNIFFLPFALMLLLITYANLTNISHDPLNASRRAIKAGMFPDITREER